jgi:hypothetical protein
MRARTSETRFRQTFLLLLVAAITAAFVAVRGVPEIAALALGESGTPCDGVLNVPAAAAVDERHLIVRHGDNHQKLMAILDLRHNNVIQLQLTSSRQSPPPSDSFMQA